MSMLIPFKRASQFTILKFVHAYIIEIRLKRFPLQTNLSLCAAHADTLFDIARLRDDGQHSLTIISLQLHI